MVFFKDSVDLISNLNFMSLAEEDLQHNRKIKLNFSNIYIKNKKTYARILSDLIYLEQIYREKYVSIAFYNNWMSYNKYTSQINAMLKDDLTSFYTRLNYYKEKERIHLIDKISSFYYYYFVYQLYANFQQSLTEHFYKNEIKRFNYSENRDKDYMLLLRNCFDSAYNSIKLFNETNEAPFLDIEKLEKDINLLTCDCIQTVYKRSLKQEYMLYYLQPYTFKAKSNTIRIRRRGTDGTLSIITNKEYKKSRKKTSTNKKKSLMEEYYNAKKNYKSLTIKEFAKSQNISERMFYYYKKDYDKELQ